MSPLKHFFTRFLLIFTLLWGGINPLWAQNTPKETLKILFLGDSLTAGYGLPQGAGFPEQLSQQLSKTWGLQVTALNAGVTGDTSTGLLNRLDWTMAQPYDIAVVAIGANDALLGINPKQTRANITAILDRLQQDQKPVLLLGMIAPPNLGTTYGQQFNSIYPDLSQKYALPLYPFLLQDVAAIPPLNQPDTIHPNTQGVAVIVKNLLPFFTTHIRP